MLIYMGLAVKDLVRAAAHIVSTGHPDPDAYLNGIRDRIETMYAIKNPGVIGRREGTVEWMLNPPSYVAVLKWAGPDAKIYRVLPTARMKKPRPQIGIGCVRRPQDQRRRVSGGAS
ncbi:hypothetical protein J2X57_001646 [Luteibacter sp. 1214]|uniref:hypothetical protein n=1 Tax=Luteibacter sp. 1214 TaxID=2817735 RepID=UPI0028601A27|nr:hypothetical protein [Luteibacter sp. 1214]MDR6642439.1 hypothetical protein [Luteibacter sp. 1214]